ncbi:MAG: hypothetical protein M3N93_03495 [Acidobacteriota bacterium]|nr:hypothetical protein [Acidobacteriota bacterium]
MHTQTQSRPLTFGLTLLSALGRVIPHAPNVTPLGGSCLFAGSRIAGIWAYLLPLAVMIATDPIVGHAGGAAGGYTWGSPLIYASLMLNVWIGRMMLRKVSAVRVGAAAFLCSLQFFVLADLAVWLGAVARHNPIYAASLNGLLTCYIEALPFWGRTLAGDLFYAGAIFGLYALLSRRAETQRSAGSQALTVG